MWARRVVVLLAGALVVAGCSSSSSSDDGDGGPEPDDGLTVDPAGRFGIPADETPEGLGLCAVDGPSDADAAADADQAGTVAVYGDTGADDPYAGEMLAVLSTPEGEGEVDHAGDGDPTPVQVRGTEGVAAPITVFPQTVLPELGTVVAWPEDGSSVGLYGRLWPPERTAELVALADALESGDEGLRLPDAALPAGYGLVYDGSAASTSLLFPLVTDYEVHYRTGDGQGDGVVVIQGLHGSAEEFEVFRFLTLDLDEADVHGIRMVTGNAWGANGPAVAAWREPDGPIVRIVGTGVDLPVVVELAQYTRQLTPDEWTALAASTTPCTDD